MSNYAPMFIPTMCRYEHFKKCIDSLSKNSLAIQTHLFIALDYPLNETHEEGYSKILNYVNTIVGFKQVTLIKRSSNYGAVRNSEEGVNEVFTYYDRIIFSEDDNEFSPNFLAYVNEGLDLFYSEKRIYAVCGYSYPVDYLPDTESNCFFWKGISAWGYGTWRDRFGKFAYSKGDIEKSLSSYRYFRKQNHYSPSFYRTLVLALYCTHPLMDAYISMKLLLNDYYCVFPKISKVRNLGHDGSGEHCGSQLNDLYSNQKIDTSCSFNYRYNAIAENDFINRKLNCFFSVTFRAQIKNCLLWTFFFLRSLFHSK